MKKPKMTPQSDGYGSVHTVRIPLWPYLVAPLFCLVALPATWGVHRAYGTSASSAGWTGFSVALAAIGALVFTALLSRPRGVVMQVMATVNGLLACAWMVPAILEGPFTKPMVGFWLLGTIFISFDCALYRIMRQARGDDGAHGQVLNGEFAELGDAVKQLKGVRFGRPVVEGAKVTSAIEAQPGRTFSEVAAAKAEIASLLDVPATAVRTPPNADSERRGSISVVPRDQLRDPIPDPGVEAGLSIADPVTLGLSEDGTPAQIILTGEPVLQRNAVGVMSVCGMSGSGKTELNLRLLKEVTTRYDNDTFVIDCRKSGQLPPWVRRAAKKVVSGKEEALDFLDDVELEIGRRSDALGARGFKQWVKGCGIPFQTYVIFEASSIVMQSNIVDLSEAVRSVGMCIVLEHQRMTWDRLPTSARSNITTHICLGVHSEGDAEGALSEDTVDAGASPWKWQAGKPGYFYLEWAGRPQETWSAPCRAFIQDDADRAAEVGAVLGWNDDVPERAAPVQAYVPPAPRGGQEPDHREDDDSDDDVPPGVDPEDPPDDVDPAEPIVIPPDMPRFPIGDSRPAMTPAEAVGVLRQFVMDAEAANVPYLRPQDCSDVLAQTGQSGSWLQNKLKVMCDEGRLRMPREGERGVYRIVQRERAQAGVRP